MNANEAVAKAAPVTAEMKKLIGAIGTTDSRSLASIRGF
jgi:hypothetical protein